MTQSKLRTHFLADGQRLLNFNCPAPGRHEVYKYGFTDFTVTF